MGKRFWEYYLVRYLAGTIFGIITVMYLVFNYDKQITPIFLKTDYTSQHQQPPTAKGSADTSKGTKYNASESLSVFDKAYTALFVTTEQYLVQGKANIFVPTKSGYEQLDTLGMTRSTQTKTDVPASLTVTTNTVSIISLLILAVIGFIYMYFSSALILYLHTYRMVFFPKARNWVRTTDDGKSQDTFSIGWGDLASWTVGVVKPFVEWVRSPVAVLFAVFAIGVIVAVVHYGWIKSIQFIPLVSLVMLFFRPRHGQFYTRLSYRRSRQHFYGQHPQAQDKELKSEVGEYVESYKHLREHGNAFGIILAELVLAALLIWSNFSIFLICSWALMGFISWWVGTYLETYFIRE